MPIPLYRHPDTPSGAIRLIDADLERIEGGAIATFKAIGDISRLKIPSRGPAVRADELWRTTCFELFAGTDREAYREFNLSPSGAWAAYDFASYRGGMSEAPAQISIATDQNDESFSMTATILSDFPQLARVGLTAVIEEADGIIRYWSASFAPGKSDFHAAPVRSLILDAVSAA